jgi:Domain of unknown function (DUF4337)
MDNVEIAQDSLEKAHGHPHDAGRWTRYAAILVACLAAIAVIVEMSGNDAQTAYLANHVSASDIWAQYQGKSVRRTVFSEAADALESQPGAATDPAIRARIDAARKNAARMQSEPGHDGMEQLSARAEAFEHVRDHELHLYERMERSVRGLQIAIVLTGLFMATRMTWLLVCGGALGAVSAVYAALVGFGAM